VPAIENCKLDKLTPEIEEWTPIGGQLKFENNPVLLLWKLQQLREAAKPFVALRHYFEHGYTVSNKPLTITRGDLRNLAEAAK
jgi:ferric iron reductase protein FhuF